MAKRKRDDIENDGMKLRSGKVVFMNLDSVSQQLINIHNSVKLELRKTIDTLKFLLKDDQPFLKKIVEMSLSLGKGVFSNEIDGLVTTKYHDYTSGVGGHDMLLLYTTSDFGRLIYGDHPLIRRGLEKLPVSPGCLKKWEKINQALYTETIEEVGSMFKELLNIEESSINITGESKQPFNEML